MATLSVWKFDDVDGAGRAERLLLRLQQQELIHVHDAATVTWEVGKKKPKTRQLAGTAAMGALSGSFWGMLFGLIFFVPLLGMAVGAAFGALGGAMSDVGINDEFINAARENVVPGTSALFLLTSDTVQDKVFEALRSEGLHPQLITTNLSKDEESRLQHAFAEND
jgi:uncharacterized membrane protein